MMAFLFNANWYFGSLKLLKGSRVLIYFLIYCLASFISLRTIFLFSIHPLFFRENFQKSCIYDSFIASYCRKMLFYWLHSEQDIFNLLVFLSYFSILVRVLNTTTSGLFFIQITFLSFLFKMKHYFL